MNYDDIQEAAKAVSELTNGIAPEIAIVLGSGLSDYGAKDGAVGIAYGEIPGFPVPKVEGHAGTLVSAIVGGQGALILAGRAHFYEGWSMDEVVFGVRTAVASGAKVVVLTNAAGSVNEALPAGLAPVGSSAWTRSSASAASTGEGGDPRSSADSPAPGSPATAGSGSEIPSARPAASSAPETAPASRRSQRPARRRISSAPSGRAVANRERESATSARVVARAEARAATGSPRVSPQRRRVPATSSMTSRRSSPPPPGAAARRSSIASRASRSRACCARRQRGDHCATRSHCLFRKLP